MNFQYSGTSFISELQMPFCTSVLTLIFMFIFYYMGQMWHSRLMNFSDLIYETKWHRYSCPLRPIVLLMMMRSQQPFYFSAYGIMALNFENFVNVSKYLPTRNEIKCNSYNIDEFELNCSCSNGFIQHSCY